MSRENGRPAEMTTTISINLTVVTWNPTRSFHRVMPTPTASQLRKQYYSSRYVSRLVETGAILTVAIGQAAPFEPQLIAERSFAVQCSPRTPRINDMLHNVTRAALSLKYPRSYPDEHIRFSLLCLTCSSWDGARTCFASLSRVLPRVVAGLH